jgi:hypothetical protein
MRWLGIAGAAQVALGMALVTHFLHSQTSPRKLVTVLAAAAVVYLPPPVLRVNGAIAASTTSSRAEDLFMLGRDIAATLRSTQTQGDITVLASPNVSPVIAYYGQFRTVGTLYWENRDGLRAAGSILTAANAEEASRLIRERRITHIALTSAADFLAEYFVLLHPGLDPSGVRQTFGFRLLYEDWVPEWLQPIPYSVPPDLDGLDVRVALFRVAFDQSPNDAVYYSALRAASRNDFAAAASLFDQLVRRESTQSRGWLGRTGVLLAMREWDAATNAAIEAIGHSEATQRTAIAERMANRLLEEREDGLAIRVYRVALEHAFDPDVACSLAYVLATSSDSRVRNGPEAVSYAKRALAQRPSSPVHQMCLAAALAESGIFVEAEATAQGAVRAARAAGDVNAARAAESMVARFRERRPVRR